MPSFDTLISWLSTTSELSTQTVAVLFLIFFVAGFVIVPRTFLCLGAGASFGFHVIWIILPSTTLGGVGAFLLARYFFSNRARAFIDRRQYSYRIAAAIDQEGWRIVALLRLASPVPNAIQNYLFGLTRINIWPYILSTFLFTLPQLFLYVYLGAVGRTILIDQELSIVNKFILGAGFASAATTVLLIVRRVRRQCRSLYIQERIP